MVTVIVAHEHRLVRQALSKILSLQSHITVVADAISGADAMKKAEQFSPDVIVVDSSLTGLVNMSGADGGQPMTNPEVVILPRRRSIAQGDAISHLNYNEDIRALIDAVLEVGGQKSGGADDDLKCREALDTLTRREKQVLSLLADGLSNKQIAHLMTITERTVKYHISNILRKLDLFSRTEAAVVFLKSNLVS